MHTNTYHKTKYILDLILVGIGLISLICFIFVSGFYLNNEWYRFFLITSKITLGIFVLQELIRWFIVPDKREYARSRIAESLIVILVISEEIFPSSVLSWLAIILPEMSINEYSLLLISLTQLAVLISILIKALRYNRYINKIQLNSGSLLTISFILVIAIGTFFLLLPRSVSYGEQPLSFTNALFTSVSAVCVTGLVVVDTATQFSIFGKLIIGTLIQVGGLGLMTLTSFIAIMVSGNLSVRAKVLMKDILSQENINEGINLLFKILAFTFFIEIIGAILLYLSISNWSLINFNKGVFFDCLFHSISAFCNAGFSVYSEGLMKQNIQSNYTFISVIMVLIVLGGLGFFTLNDVFRNFWKKQNRRKIKISSKIIIITTLILIISGMIVFSVFESTLFSYTNLIDQFFHSLFLSVTSRTAGFNALPMDVISNAGIMFLIILMWIGASPGSTGGGVKTSTVAVAIITLFNYIRGKERIEVFKREISPENSKQALMVITSSLLFLGFGTTMLVWIEPNIEPLHLIFEATSAISTVGLSIGITPSLTDFSKYILIILMFVGRIGVFTFFLSLYKPKSEPRFRLPSEKIMIG